MDLLIIVIAICVSWGVGALTFGVQSREHQAICSIVGALIGLVIAKWVVPKQGRGSRWHSVLLAAAFLSHVEASYADLAPVTADKLPFTTDDIETQRHACLSRQRNHGVYEDMAEAYCRCFAEDVPLYVTRHEWNEATRWMIESAHVQQDTSRAPTVFFDDVAPTVAEIRRVCRDQARALRK